MYVPWSVKFIELASVLVAVRLLLLIVPYCCNSSCSGSGSRRDDFRTSW